MTSNPVEELSSGAKSRVVSRLLKRKVSVNPTKENLTIDKGSSKLIPSSDNKVVSTTATPIPDNKSEVTQEIKSDAKKVDNNKIDKSKEGVKEDCTITDNAKKADNAKKTDNAKKADTEPKGQTGEVAVKSTHAEPDESKDTAGKKETTSLKDKLLKGSKQPDGGNSPPSPVQLQSEPAPANTPTTKEVVKPQIPKPSSPLKPDLDDTNNNSVTVTVHGRKVRVVHPEGYKDSSFPVDPPQERLQLDWIYGYRGNDCRSNIRALSNDDVIYFISNIAVLYNRDSHTQRHYREHTEDIKSMAVHSNGHTVATGQYAGKKDQKQEAHVRIWRSDTLSTTHVLGTGTFHKTVMCLAFQNNTDFLAAVDNSQEKRLSLWNAATGSHIADTVLHAEVICDIEFNPQYPDIVVTIGKEHLAWWKIYPEMNKIMTHAKADYDTYLRAKFVISLVHTEKGDLITGDSNGTIYVWGDGKNKITNFVKHGHDGPVFTVLFHRHHVISGGRDGMVYSWQWTKNMDCDGRVEVSKSEGGVRVVSLHRETLLLGTTMNSILSIILPEKGGPLEGSSLEMIPLTQGHFDELRGLTTIQKSLLGADVLTAGLDGIICKFNSDTHKPVWKIVIKGASFLCVDSSEDGRLLALGTQDGHLVILQLEEDMSVIELFNNKISKERIDVVRLSPDCQSIAFGGHDRAVYVYTLQEKEEGSTAWEMLGMCKGHHAAITAVDWSTDKQKLMLRTSSAIPEQYFWNPGTCQREEAKNAVSQTWVTNSCTLDFKVTGIWNSSQAKEGHINTVDINPGKSAIAMGDNCGYLSLFRYPCPKDGAFSQTYKCHQNVQVVRFSPTGSHVISVGGRDSCIMQWKIV